MKSKKFHFSEIHDLHPPGMEVACLPPFVHYILSPPQKKATSSKQKMYLKCFSLTLDFYIGLPT